MIVRRDQLRDILIAQNREMVEHLAKHLESNFGAELESFAMTICGLREQVIGAIDDARRYGITEGQDLRLYVECLALLGPGFDQNPETIWTFMILCRQDLDGTAKMDAISDGLMFGAGGPR